MDIDAVTSCYKALARLVPLKAVTSETEYRKVVSALEQLLDAGGANLRHQQASCRAVGAAVWGFCSRIRLNFLVRAGVPGLL